MTFATGLSVVTLSLHHRGMRGTRLPPLLRRIVLRILAPILHIKLEGSGGGEEQAGREEEEVVRKEQVGREEEWVVLGEELEGARSVLGDKLSMYGPFLR